MLTLILTSGQLSDIHVREVTEGLEFKVGVVDQTRLIQVIILEEFSNLISYQARVRRINSGLHFA